MVCDDRSEFVLYRYVLFHALIQAVEMTVAQGWWVWDCKGLNLSLLPLLFCGGMCNRFIPV